MSFWPEPYQAAVTLTFDDGLPSQLERAVPILDQTGLHGTFYLNPRGKEEYSGRGGSWMETLLPWQPVQARGHEMGNHTVVHPCSLNTDLPWVREHNLIDYTLEMIEAEILEAQRRINAAFPGQKENTFAYPCYESEVGRGKNRASYTPIVAKYFVAGRHRSEVAGNLANDPRRCDLHHLNSWPVERQQGELMIGLVDQAVRLGGWAVFAFHGIHEGHLSVSEGDFSMLVEYLARRKDIWTAPLVEIGKFVQPLQI
jgi:peptidoglycan-N-acetylglucosamine deacetylase